ncbi:L,D-transpeptidase family protein [Rhizobium tumorigenes]|uniref:L,D-transpeptidase family protein n=1 Tax=Rhizobium tumorigenes TaxID=2041385 RepID=A0AAF1KTU3_9HYPH|nr:L,D-transpeptidase family protein [Rhizobium tumorigenes]WFR97645.1 L,D-transpeptidase family protein [Rhizobium tumorigenes]
MQRFPIPCAALSLLSSLLLTGPTVAAPTNPAKPPSTTQGDATQVAAVYPAPARRVARIAPQIETSALAALFDPVAAGQAKVFHEMAELQVPMNIDIADTVEAYYSQPKAKLIWVDGKGPTLKAAQAISLMKQAGDWGLSPEDYSLPATFEALPAGSDERTKALALFEVSLSSKMLMFLQDNFRGRIDPNQLSHYYDFKRKPVDLKATLAQLSTLPELMPVFERLLPGNPKFTQLALELHFLRTSEQRPDTSTDINKVIVAMEEIRWLPQQFPQRYVFINQPAYMTYYNENDATALSMKAVIGQQDHQTNFFEGSIKTVEFNPDWGVPQSIIHNEMLPHLKRHPAYLDKEGYVVSVKGKQMPSAKVDWSQPLENISVVQPPGPDNALGQLKILFPNAHAIYMHDTPARGKFASQDRMFSHGCVRLENPRAMAAAVLNQPVDFVSQQIQGGEKKDMPVPEQIPVFVAYFTAWPNTQGTVEYFDDIYGRDAQTLTAMSATTASRTQP